MTHDRPSPEWRTMLWQGGGSMGVRFLALGLTALSSIVFARALGSEGYGIYAFSFSLLALIGIPVSMGIPTLVLRETSQSRSAEAWGRMKAVWGWATRRILLVTVPVLLLGLTSVYLLSSKQIFFVVLIGAPLVPLVALTLTRDASQRALLKVVSGQLSNGLVRPVVTLVLVSSVWFLTDERVSPVQAMACTVAAALAAFSSATMLLRIHTPSAAKVAIKSPNNTAWARAIWPLAGLTAIQTLTDNIGVIAVGVFSTPNEVANFKIAQSANAFSVIGLAIVSLVVAPRIADLYSRKEMLKLQKLIAVASAFSLAGFLPMVAVLALWGEPIIVYLYGTEFKPAYQILLFLMAGQIVNAFFGAVISLLNMTGHERIALVGLASGAISYLAIAIALTPHFGAIGAAIASSAAMLIWNLALWYGALTTIGINSTAFGFLTAKKRT